MLSAVRNLAVAIISAAVWFSFVLSDRAHAQTYQIDCAILLCLAGGWPASEPCTRARAEFIRRITPWPVEPPLQIWRCPMGASYEPGSDRAPSARLYDIIARLSTIPLPHPFPTSLYEPSVDAAPAILRTTTTRSAELPERFALQLAQDRADIDISGSEFNFVRSIRVFDVRYARQQESGRDGDCNRMAVVSLGTYRTQGDFSWQRSSPGALPSAHVGLERWGDHCPSIWHRSVFVEWRDYEGNYGFEQVNY
ncbi:hypothetical protein [uncultured Roseobacter sp.]|uniref:hypothetical protein n=1 Tax=uncultured Roseobacter sp. TaxID=114847 RepID=UPI002627FFCC|nr:hypothetical protein [uncultured Roseobacter sp.]